MEHAELEATLLAKYNTHKATRPLRPMARTREETIALLTGDTLQKSSEIKEPILRVITTKEAAALIGISRETLRYQTKIGKIEKHSHGLYRREDIDMFKRRYRRQMSTEFSPEQEQAIRDVYSGKSSQSVQDLANQIQVSRKTILAHARRLGCKVKEKKKRRKGVDNSY